MEDFFNKFIRQTLVPLTYTPSEISFMKQLRSSGSQYSDLAEILKSYPELEKKLLQQIQKRFSSRFEEPPSSTTFALSLIGFFQTRKLLAEALQQKAIDWIFPDSEKALPSLKYALEAEQLIQQFSSELFVGGLIFDILSSLLDPSQSNGELQKQIASLWKKSIESGQLGKQFAERIFLPSKKSSFSELLLDGIFHHIGKLFLGLEKAKDSTKKRRNPELFELLQEPVQHPVLGFLILEQFKFLKDFSCVTLYHHEPFLAKRCGEWIHQRAHLLWLSDTLMEHKKAFGKKKPEPFFLDTWVQVVSKAFPDTDPKNVKNGILSWLTG